MLEDLRIVNIGHPGIFDGEVEVGVVSFSWTERFRNDKGRVLGETWTSFASGGKREASEW
jgi:hypothetical protein